MSEPVHAADWTTLALDAHGRSLIEASAGTGKTWTISALYLRLILDTTDADGAVLTPRRIVVATFTDAAADELRARIRGRLLRAAQLADACGPNVQKDALAVFDQLDGADGWLRARWVQGNAKRTRDAQRLRLALVELDLAPIGTLHGLCRRVLRDYPFESGGAFAKADLVAGDEMLDELTADLWRRLQQGETFPPAFASVKTLKDLRKRLKLCLMPGVGLWAPSAREIDAALPASWATRIEALANDKRIWGQKKNIPINLRLLAAWLRDRTAPWSLDEADRLADAVAHLAGQDDYQGERQFLARSERLLQYAAASGEIRAWQAWTKQVETWRDARLAATDRLTFDDLLTRVHDALAREGSTLAERLFEDWPVALVDEFQDTDSVQYTILDRIYHDAAGAPRGRLVMIGDPKQAIYSFRGGDIDTYRRAAASAQARLTLGVNFRSTPAYVDALNEWFARARAGLSADLATNICVEPVSASRADEAIVAGPPLVIHYQGAAPAKKDERVTAALTACAEQIVALLNEEHDGARRRAQPGDLAVLLPAHKHLTELRALLAARRVPCVGAGKGSVFETEWARELQIALHAIEHGGDGALRAALATRLGGLDYAALIALRDAPERMEEHARRFAQLKQRWHREGVLAVVLELARDAMLRIGDLAERERALTDLRHLGELLEQQDQRVHGPEQLLAWLGAQRERNMSEADLSDERLLRIESDAKRVRLMTLHMSKGLEFPVVFLPLMWAHEGAGSDCVIEEPLCKARIIGFGAQAKAQYERENQDERFRVLYVALTRARDACHVFAYSPRRLPRANSKQPLGDPQRSALDAMLDRLIDGASRPQPALLAIAWRDAAWPQDVTAYVAPAHAPMRAPIVLAEPRALPREGVWSFSALTKRRPLRDEEAAADDEEGVVDENAAVLNDAAEAEPDVQLLALSMLRGAEFGNALHAIFELRRIGEPIAVQEELIECALREAGVHLRALPRSTVISRIAQRLDAVLAAPLGGGLRLGDVSARALRAEMDFRFALDAVSLRRLREACAQHGEPDLVPTHLNATTLRGLMTGKIDLVIAHGGRFHVLDYKSNHLGDTLADYTPIVLCAAMDAHHYRFQALLYAVAVDRYLRGRIADYRREAQLGDAIYLFVRAVGIAPELGIWRERFDEALLAAVDRVLAGTAAWSAA